MKLSRGDIILVPFPFTDLSSSKVRPAIIVSADPQLPDVTIAFISSVISDRSHSSEFLLTTDELAFKDTGLKVASVFKMRKLVTINDSRIIRYLGHADNSLQEQIDKCLKAGMGLS